MTLHTDAGTARRHIKKVRELMGANNGLRIVLSGEELPSSRQDDLRTRAASLWTKCRTPSGVQFHASDPSVRNGRRDGKICDTPARSSRRLGTKVRRLAHWIKIVGPGRLAEMYPELGANARIPEEEGDSGEERHEKRREGLVRAVWTGTGGQAR